jgi:hypothetical protein
MGFSQQELFALLDIIEEHLPIAMDDWDLIAADHAAMYPDSLRTSKSLRQKFVLLYRKKIPTDDPKYPPDVRRAKFIIDQIKKSVDLSEGEEVQQVVQEVVGDEEEEDGQSSAADCNRDADGNRTGPASDGDFDGDGNTLSGGEGNKEEGEELNLRYANDSANKDMAAGPTSHQVDETANRVSTAARAATSVGGSSVGSRSSNGGGHATISTVRRNLNTPTTSSTTFGSSSTGSNCISRTGSKRARQPITDNDDDNISIKQLMKMAYMQQEQDRADHKDEERLHCDEMHQNQQFLQQMMMTMVFAPMLRCQTGIRRMLVGTTTTNSMSKRTMRMGTNLDKNSTATYQQSLNLVIFFLAIC